MRLPSLLLQLGLVGLAFASHVLDLDAKNFDETVLKSGKPSLVEFFAPWCGHCKNLAPTYESLATAFAHSEDVNVAKVDADAHKDLGGRFGVQGFPTLKWFDGKSDKPADYSGGRELDDLAKFIQEKTGIKPKIKKAETHVVMLNDAKFNSSIGGDRHALVAFTAPWCGHCKSLAPTWESLAATFAPETSVLIAKVDAEAPDSAKTAAAFEIKGYPTIKWFPAHATEPEAYSGGRSEADLVAFVNEKAGTFRSPGGRLSEKAGLIAALDALLEKGEDVLAAAKEEKSKYGQYYSRVAEKVKENAGYVEKELGRLQGILKKGALGQEKLDDLVTRSNILMKFYAAKRDRSEKSEL